jgi:hypothetical protein
MPGDPGQPTTGSSVIAAGQIGAGSCVAWQFTSTVNVSGTTVTWVSGKRFGMTLSAGASVSINNSGVANNTVASHDILGADQDTQFTLGSSAGTLTNATLIWANPPSQWVGGCGDDIEDAVDWNCDNCWMKDGYVEKVHWINSESHAVLTGFSNGPVKFVNNWWEGGSCSYFSGGGPVDTSAGPTNDEEVRKNYFGRDESYRQLSAGVANSPEPPFGCGPMDHNAAHDTCPFQWAIKNTFELKLANRFLVDGNIIENAWADGQSGYPVLITDAVCSGGKVCGIKTNTGDPRTSIQNVHISNTWIRNAAMPIQLKNRAGGPGVGGGLATAVSNIDFYNDLITNVDDNEWGNNASGTAQTDIVQWQAGANNYLCTMSRVSNVATATCSAGGLTNTGKWANSTAYSIGNAVVNDGGLYIASTNHTSSTATKPPTGASWQANWTRQASNTYALPLSSGTLDQITRDASGLVTVSMGGQRVDILNGGTVFLGGQSGWNGTFTINAVFFGGGTGTPGSSNTLCNATNVAGTPNNIIVTAGLFVSNSCMRADGTFSTTFTYQDNTNPHVAGTLCSAATTSCDSMPNMAFSFPSLAYNNTDIHIGDGVITSECLQSNLSTVDATYPTPSNSSVLAATGTVTPGLAVAYANTGANDSSGVVCALENDAGQPKNMLWSQNTTLITNLRSIGGSALNIQSINNYFTNNIFETTGANKAILRCDATGNGEGTVSGGGADCWDRTTLQWGNNVMVGRATINWPPVNGSANFTSPSPSTVDCPGGTASSSCVGMSGFMNGITFPTTACTATLGNQNNCPLMAAPWATNVTLNSFGLVGSSSYQGLGADTTQMNTAFTNSGYVCPVGISCGSHGPYPD